ncbi:MAG: DUF535 family protein [Chlorobiaceae bacterium]
MIELKNTIDKITKFEIRRITKKTLTFLLNIHIYLRLKSIIRYNSGSLLYIKKLRYAYWDKILSSKFSIKDNIIILIYQLEFIDKYGLFEIINNLTINPVFIWSLSDSINKFGITLSVPQSIKEGMISLIYTFNDEDVFVLKYSIIPGCIVQSLSDNVIFISVMQLVKNKKDIYQQCICKNFGTTPQRNLFYALLGIAKRLNIAEIYCVNAESQVYFQKDNLSFYETYNNFINTFDTVELRNSYYLLKLPYNEKPIQSITSSHRRRAKVRRKFNQDIQDSVYMSFDSIIHAINLEKEKNYLISCFK